MCVCVKGDGGWECLYTFMCSKVPVSVNRVLGKSMLIQENTKRCVVHSTGSKLEKFFFLKWQTLQTCHLQFLSQHTWSRTAEQPLVMDTDQSWNQPVHFTDCCTVKQSVELSVCTKVGNQRQPNLWHDMLLTLCTNVQQYNIVTMTVMFTVVHAL